MAENRVTTLLGQGREAQARGDLAKAERLLTEAVASGAEGYADVHHALGMIYHSWGLYSKARAAFEKALELNGRYTEAALHLAITYNDLGRYAEAQELLGQVMPQKSEGLDILSAGKIANLHAELGDAYRSAGQPQEAVVEYRRALGLCPSFVDIRSRLAKALSEHGDRRGAIEELRLTLAENPKFIPALLQLGLLAHAEGDFAEAQKALETALEVEPNHARAAAYLRMLEPKDNKS